jgi:predicted nucleic acid-binding protein
VIDVATLAILDTDTLSELARGNLHVRSRASEYLATFGRLTTTAITIFERIRGYRLAIKEGRPLELQLEAFERFATESNVLPFDEDAAGVAAALWAAVTRARRRELGDILIAAIAISRQLPLVTRNRRDFENICEEAGMKLPLLDWTRPVRKGGA